MWFLKGSQKEHHHCGGARKKTHPNGPISRLKPKGRFLGAHKLACEKPRGECRARSSEPCPQEALTAMPFCSIPCMYTFMHPDGSIHVSINPSVLQHPQLAMNQPSDHFPTHPPIHPFTHPTMHPFTNASIRKVVSASCIHPCTYTCSCIDTDIDDFGFLNA